MDASVTQASDGSGEIWFFSPDNVELVVKVLDACGLEGFDNYWVFTPGLTNLGVTVTVTDTKSGTEKVYENKASDPFEPVLDTAAFQTCP